MKVLVIGGSNSKNSINKALAYFTAQLFDGATISKIDVSQLNIPLFSIDKENEGGILPEVIELGKRIDETDFIVLSLAENNGSFNVGFKNMLDWISRIKGRKTFNGKPMLLMATSPGSRGGATVLDSAKQLFPHLGASVQATFSLPHFYQNFDFEKGITNEALLGELKSIISRLKKS